MFFFDWINIGLKVFAVLWGLLIAFVIVAYFTLGGSVVRITKGGPSLISGPPFSLKQSIFGKPVKSSKSILKSDIQPYDSGY
jgi:hypothetical protein